jgi:hypothetical protein
VDVHTQALGALRGPLVSAMVVGARVVDLDGNLRTAFTRAGLAHTIAASGFHVSLLLGTVLALTNRLGLRTQMLAGLGALGLFVMLAGFEAGVARASLMGAVGLWGSGANRPRGCDGETAAIAFTAAGGDGPAGVQPNLDWQFGVSIQLFGDFGVDAAGDADCPEFDAVAPSFGGVDCRADSGLFVDLAPTTVSIWAD